MLKHQSLNRALFVGRTPQHQQDSTNKSNLVTSAIEDREGEGSSKYIVNDPLTPLSVVK
jgi:hypothetical protein